VTHGNKKKVTENKRLQWERLGQYDIRSYANKQDIRTSAEQAVVHESRGDLFRSSSENGARHDRSYTGIYYIE